MYSDATGNYKRPVPNQESLAKAYTNFQLYKPICVKQKLVRKVQFFDTTIDKYDIVAK